MLPVILVQFSLDVGVGDQRRCFCKIRKIGRNRGPMSVNHIEPFGLAIKIPGIARLIFLFQIES